MHVAYSYPEIIPCHCCITWRIFSIMSLVSTVCRLTCPKLSSRGCPPHPYHLDRARKRLDAGINDVFAYDWFNRSPIQPTSSHWPYPSKAENRVRWLSTNDSQRPREPYGFINLGEHDWALDPLFSK